MGQINAALSVGLVATFGQQAHVEPPGLSPAVKAFVDSVLADQNGQLVRVAPKCNCVDFGSMNCLGVGNCNKETWRRLLGARS